MKYLSVCLTPKHRRSEFDDLAVLLPDWQISLRARGRIKGTIDDYLNCARSFYGFLVVNGMPTEVSSIKREHVEHFLAEMFERVSPATVTKHYRLSAAAVPVPD